MRSRDIAPAVAAVVGPEDAQHTFLQRRGERIDDRRLGRRDRQRGPAEPFRRRQSVRQLGPRSAAIGRSPDAALGTSRRDGCEQRVANGRVKDDRMAPVLPIAGEVQPSPAQAAVPGHEHAVAAAFTVGHAAETEVRRVKGVDDQASDTCRDVGRLGRCENLPAVAAVDRSENADAGIGICRKVCLARPTIQDRGIDQVHGDRSNIERRLVVPKPAPVFSAVLTLPNTAACSACPDDVRFSRSAADGRHPPADIRGTDQLPIGYVCLRGQRGSRARTLPDQRVGGRFSIRPRGAGLKPDCSLLVGGRAGCRRAARTLLLRRLGKIELD